MIAAGGPCLQSQMPIVAPLTLTKENGPRLREGRF